MISGAPNKNFFQAHWDWLVALGGLAILGVSIAFMMMEFGVDPEDKAQETKQEASGSKRKDNGVEKVSMRSYGAMFALNFKEQKKVVLPSETMGSFLASDKRIFCEQGDDTEHKSCGKPMPADEKVCTFCQTKQPVEKKIDRDSDGDGLSDSWETENGLDPNNPDDAFADLDGDGFSNIDEIQKFHTDFRDASSHPDYLDYVRVKPELEQTTVSFYLEKSMPSGKSWRVFFKDPTKKNNYGAAGKSYSPIVGEDIGDTGYTLKSYTKKMEQQTITKGGKSRKTEVDVSIAEIVRKADGKLVPLVTGVRNTPVDTQATIIFELGAAKEFIVAAGAEITLFDTKYSVKEISEPQKNDVKVTLKNLTTGKERVVGIQAVSTIPLEQ